VALTACCAVVLPACSNAESARLQQTTKPTYDKTTGKLTELTYDANKNGKIDTWTEMDGSRPLRSRIDVDEDGAIDRWEYYDGNGALLKVGLSRQKNGKPDAWVFARADGTVDRIEVSSTQNEAKIDRWEYYDEKGALAALAFDENGDGRPDRRLTYADGRLTLIESAPDAAGRFHKKVRPE
jgi:hypothetical protein